MTAQLLRAAGAPFDPSAERAARVQAIVHREWRTARRRRTIRRGVLIGLLAAASVTVAIGINQGRGQAPSIGPDLAVAQRIQGHPLIIGLSRHAAPRLAPSTPVYANDVLETDNESRAGLQLADGSSIRVDHDSRVRLLSPKVFEVMAGAAYVATVAPSHGFEVRTPLGTLRDVGTQFEVRLTPSLLRVRVRSGSVEIRQGVARHIAAARTEAAVTTTGIAVSSIPVYGAEWAWTIEVAPAFAIEGRTLASYLEYVVAEQGWTLHYEHAAAAEAAARTVLHGSVDGLSAEDALRVVLTASDLQYRLRSGELFIFERTRSR